MVVYKKVVKYVPIRGGKRKTRKNSRRKSSSAARRGSWTWRH